jgi:hypothetical protein
MRCSILILFLVATSLFAQQSPVPEIRYRSVPDFLKLPTDLYFGEVAGVAVNSFAARPAPAKFWMRPLFVWLLFDGCTVPEHYLLNFEIFSA